MTYALVAIAALAAGGLGAQTLQAVGRTPTEEPWADVAQVLRQNQSIVVRLAGDVKGLKADFDDLKRSVQEARAESATRQSELAERLQRFEKASGPKGDATLQIASLAERIERLDSGNRDAAPRLEALVERLDRIEHRVLAAASPAETAPAAPLQVAAATLPAPETPALTGSLAPQAAPQPPQKDNTVDGWVLHDVSDGIALIESRNRRLVEVGLGEMVPGVGRVEAIERRGKRWVVVTGKGVIATTR